MLNRFDNVADVISACDFNDATQTRNHPECLAGRAIRHPTLGDLRAYHPTHGLATSPSGQQRVAIASTIASLQSVPT
jgi:hypothetical protein